MRAGLRSEDGQTLLITVLAMVLVLLFAAVVIDISTLWVARHKAQIAADSGALAAAQDMETGNVVNATVAADGTSYALANDPGAVVGVSQPGDNSAALVVKKTIALPFGGLWGWPSGNVTARATAQVQENEAQIQDGTAAELTPSAYTGECTGNDYCEIDATSACASQPNQNESANNGHFFYGPQIFSLAWYIYTGYNTSTAKGNCASVDVQNCNGAVGGNCLDDQGNQISTDEVVDLNGDSAGGMYQTLTTTAGGHYDASFYLTGNPAGENCNAAIFTGYVQVDDLTTTGAQLAHSDFTHTNPCSNGSETARFEVINVPFVAASASTVVIFQSTTCMASAGAANTCSGNLSDYGPEVTDITMTNPSVVLTQ